MFRKRYGLQLTSLLASGLTCSWLTAAPLSFDQLTDTPIKLNIMSLESQINEVERALKVGSSPDLGGASMHAVSENPLNAKLDELNHRLIRIEQRDLSRLQGGETMQFASLTATPLKTKIEELSLRVGGLALLEKADDRIHFAFNSATLTPSAKAYLDEVAANLIQRDAESIRVAGFASSEGVASYNLKLSERRANSVRDYLVSRGVLAGAISTKGYGSGDPIASNTTSQGRELNRRVELRVH